MSFPRSRFGYHVVFDRDLLDAAEFAAANGFGFIAPDLMVPRFWPERINSTERKTLRRRLDDLGVGISFHAPSDNLPTGSAYPEVRAAINQRMKLCLDLANDLEAERLTIHPTQPNDFASGGALGSYLESHGGFYRDAFTDSIRFLSDQCGQVKVCVENEPLTPWIESALEGCFREGLKIYLTLDAPKALDPRKGDPKRVAAFYKAHRERLREIHLHDRRVGGHYHDVLGWGKVNSAAILREYAGLDVALNLEIRPRENAALSLKTLEQLWGSL